MSDTKQSLFTTDDGRNLVLTFTLVSSLFLLWGLCNGMIDVMGGALLPKLMGYVADLYDMSRGFIVPMVCFAFVAIYGYLWPKVSGAESMTAAQTAGGH